MTNVNTAEASNLTAGTWNIDPAHSEVGFSVRHLGLSKVRGRFNSFAGTVNITDDHLASSVEATIDLASVDTNNAQRDGHLQSADFFNVEGNPQMVFRSTAVSTDSLDGKLTINGVTKPVTLDLEFHGVTVDGYETTRSGFSASGEIRRSDFGIVFDAPLGLDGALIGDKVTIDLEIQAVPAG
ncbi:MAG: polyisoprenoid-binding protein YceI [Candidatus Aldehydirespiratoraceae bacterium]|jgi:polyisoprenoid-binding protein YceI